MREKERESPKESFRKSKREMESRMLDLYWTFHCRPNAVFLSRPISRQLIMQFSAHVHMQLAATSRLGSTSLPRSRVPPSLIFSFQASCCLGPGVGGTAGPALVGTDSGLALCRDTVSVPWSSSLADDVSGGGVGHAIGGDH